MKTAVLFDLDGTLVDTPRAIVETMTEVLRLMEHTVPVEPAQLRATVGLPLETAFGNIMGLDPQSETVARAVALYRETFARTVLPRAPQLLYPGVAEGLRRLKESGVTLVITTSKIRSSAEALLQAAGIADCFTLILGADLVSRPKPDPEMAYRAISELGLTPAETFVVGDTTHDLHMAQRAGLASIGVTYGVHDIATLNTAHPTYLMDSFDGVVRVCLNQSERMVAQ